MARLELDLPGPLRIMLDGAAVTCIESNKVRALLVYLASRSKPGIHSARRH